MVVGLFLDLIESICPMKDVNDLKEVPNEGAGATLVWVHWGCPFDDDEVLKLASSRGRFVKNAPVIIVGTLESCFLRHMRASLWVSARWPWLGASLGNQVKVRFHLGLREWKDTLDEIGLLNSLTVAPSDSERWKCHSLFSLRSLMLSLDQRRCHDQRRLGKGLGRFEGFMPSFRVQDILCLLPRVIS